MPVFQLSDKLIFPHPGLAEKDGLLAIGGDLSAARLLTAYANGIFPWFSDDSPIMWWSPDPRMVLYPGQLKVSKSLRQTINSKKFTITFDRNFEQVINQCAKIPRSGEHGTWITKDMIKAYVELHQLGYAHSVEAYLNRALVGGLYGLSLGRMFFGESMFHFRSDASKVALHALVQKLKLWRFDLIDAQQDTPHMRSLGASLMDLNAYLRILKNSLKHPTIKGKWCL
jgi:leucyl/phenylalanyl-tRNA---protein transferase